jgi:RNA polymerase sigma-70 factor (ECF subfamily)
VTFAMPPYPHWFEGRDAVLAVLAGSGRPDLRYLPARANAQPAVAWYVREPSDSVYRPASLEVLDHDGERITAITAFASGALVVRLGLPDGLEAPRE